MKDLYLLKKLSVRQVADALGISPARVNYWLSKINIDRRSRAEAIRYLNFTKFHKGGFKIKQHLNINEEKLRVAGSMLYGGEGTKSGNSVVLSNSDPDIICLFLKFLRKICGVSDSRLRVLLHYYSDQNENELTQYWARVTNIPRSQFSRSFLHKKSAGSYKHRSEYGTISLRYSDKKLLSIINSWISGYKKSL